MKKLTADWFMEGTLDFEYKKYLLLAYLQHVSREFAEVRLYPSFSDLIFHYKNLFSFKENKRQLFEQFPARISEEDFRKLQLKYLPELEDGDDMKEIESIIEYSLPVINQQLKEGKEIYDYIEEQIMIEPVGILPLYKKEGYLLLRINTKSTVKVYEYKIIFMENADSNYFGISMEQIDAFRLSIANTIEAMKLQLVRSYAKLPNPATFLVHVVHPIPEESSLLPVAKRKMLAYLA